MQRKKQNKPKEQSIMENQETLENIGTPEAGRRQTKLQITTQKTTKTTEVNTGANER